MPLLQHVWCFIVRSESCVSVTVAHFYTGPPATLNVDITFDTTRRARVFMRRTRKEIVLRMGRIVHLRTAMLIYVSPFMTSESWRRVPGQSP